MKDETLSLEQKKPVPRIMTRKVPIHYDYTRGQFEDLHKSGAEKFRGAWLVSNQAVVEYCANRVDVSDPAIKELLSLAVLRVLFRLQACNYLKNL